MSERRRTAILIAIGGALLLIVLLIWPSERRRAPEPELREAPPASSSFARLVGQSESTPRVAAVDCDLDWFLSQLRGATDLGSPAYRAYLFDLLASYATRLPFEQIVALLASEQDPTALEGLSRVLALYHRETGDRAAFDPLFSRLRSERSGELRAAIVRSLEATADPAGILLRELGEITYDDLIRDPATEVRETVIANLADEIDASAGHDPATSAEALRVARAASDATDRAAILSRVSLENASAAEVASARTLLRSDDHEVQAAAARALGTVGADHADEAMRELVARYRTPSVPPIVRSALLAAIVQIGFARAIPVLESLRGVDRTMEPEIDAWLAALAGGWQLFSQLEREKRRIEVERRG